MPNLRTTSKQFHQKNLNHQTNKQNCLIIIKKALKAPQSFISLHFFSTFMELHIKQLNNYVLSNTTSKRMNPKHTPHKSDNFHHKQLQTTTTTAERE